MSKKGITGSINTSLNQKGSASSSTLAAVAFQDHLVRSLSLGNAIGPRKVGLGPTTKTRKKISTRPRPVIDTGRGKSNPTKSEKRTDREYVLDPKPSPLTLAQRMGLVEAPAQPLSEAEWQTAKQKSNTREDSQQPCVICKEHFGTQEQVLLSCTHVFHKNCLQAFERFTGRKTCPMCRRDQYQTRVIHEGAKHHRIRSATLIQSLWRGYVVRCWYKRIRETVPPNDPMLRKKFYEEKFHNITDRIVRSCDFNVNSFLAEIDRNLAASRDVFKHFDSIFKQISDEEWDNLQLKAVERGDIDCPICLTALDGSNTTEDDPFSQQITMQPKSGTKQAKQSISKADGQEIPVKGKDSTTNKSKANHCDKKNIPKEHPEAIHSRRQTILLSCSHVFHLTCLEMFEALVCDSTNIVCPVCRSKYQKKTLEI